ncbi:MAG: adenylosuccinate lyase [Thermodesulfobacteriota bacterium]
MELSPLTAVSPVDGRYRKASEPLGDYFSEFALIRYRVQVEIAYLIALSKTGLASLKPFTPSQCEQLLTVIEHFGIEDARRVKEIERMTNHDVKAVEYFLREKLELLGLSAWTPWIHFGLTSQDINNTALPLSLRDACAGIYLPQLDEIICTLDHMAHEWRTIPMLARTHGQPASPTTLGKEIRVFVERLIAQVHLLKQVPFSAKFGGATGNFNAHVAAFPNVDWPKFADHFIQDLGLIRTRVTTQIEPYDNLAAFCDGIKRINTILIDLARDIWSYISMNYFHQKIQPNEVGSSTMPHKVNPIDFENAEGNLGIANAILEHLSAKLPISRLQRDLTDSTVTRNIGVPMAHTLIALSSLKRGLGKLIVHREAIEADLRNHWVVVTEGIQTILRREGVTDAYEKLKAWSRTHEVVTEESVRSFIHSLNIPESVQAELLALTPFSYIGIEGIER